jgi:DNA-binding beta-propeller fold protein YncE
MVMTPDGRSLYLVDPILNQAKVIDLRLRRLIHSIAIAPGAEEMVTTPDGSTIYVGHHAGVLTTINTLSNATTTLHTRGDIWGTLAVTTDGRYVYIPACNGGLQRLDTKTHLITTLREGRCPVCAIASPDGKEIWVSYQGGGPGGSRGHDAIAYFDAPTGRLLGSITVLPNVGATLAISPDGSRLWTNAADACSNPVFDHIGCRIVPSDLIHIIDTSTRKAIDSLPFPGSFNPGVITFSPNGKLVVVSGTKLLIFDAATRRIKYK